MFFGPLAWSLLCVALCLSGWLFLAVVKQSGGDVTASLRYTLGASTALLFLPPLLTMRMISEEDRTGMLEFLLTAPVSDASVVTGKFLAALTFMTLFWSSKLVYAVVIAALGVPPDWAPLLGGFLGAVLVSGLFCALGLVASAAFSTPMLAAFMAFVANIVVLFLPVFAGLSESDRIAELAAALSVSAHFELFLRGVLDSSGIVFFLVWTAVALFVSVRLVEARRWR
jgi:ABC-2 type transport system permease protein